MQIQRKKLSTKKRSLNGKFEELYADKTDSLKRKHR
jgi:hypothetical protein